MKAFPAVRSIIVALSMAVATYQAHATRFSSDFPSGSIGDIRPMANTPIESWRLALRDDNDDHTLPDSFRGWWYVRLDDVKTSRPIRLQFSRMGFPYDFRPVYSYDNKTWHYFSDQEARFTTQCDTKVPESCVMSIEKQFERSTVWIARTFPYPYENLQSALKEYEKNPYVHVDTIGASPTLGLPVNVIRVEDPLAHPSSTIVIHARTHAAETGASYVLEGLMDTLLHDKDIGPKLRSRYVFKIIPMLNVDGVELGNYRTNATSQNLEENWVFDPSAPVYLTRRAPVENRMANRNVFADALLDSARPVALALNLHSSNEEPDTQAYFFPHFGTDPALYTPQQIALRHKQMQFIRLVSLNYNYRIETPKPDGGGEFLKTFFPETWWWANRHDQVNAMTLETTYGRAGFDHWVTADDLRDLGRALAYAITDMDTPASRLLDPSLDSVIFRHPYKPELYDRKSE